MATADLRPRDLEVLRAIFERHPCVREVVLFGSRATGHARRASDIDLAIDAPTAIGLEWSALQEALEESPILFEIDALRRDAIASERLREAIARDGVRIYAAA